MQWHTLTADSINDGIWRLSPSVQQEVQPSEVARQLGIGAQQAMLLENRVLPWVPDILGQNWQERDSLLIVGSAYAPFVRGSATRTRAMSVADYAHASSWQAFQAAFIASVIEGDNSYYGPLSDLAAATSTPDECSRLAFFDLCRASFVERDAAGGFKGGDRIVGRHCSLFERYVEHPQSRSWLWQRLSSSKAIRIVALGTIAEHGLLRLFERQRCELRIAGVTKRLVASANGTWVKRYAAADHKLTFWVEAGAWWDIAGPGGRRWRLLPIPHPSAWGRESGYKQQRELLSEMLTGAD